MRGWCDRRDTGSIGKAEKSSPIPRSHLGGVKPLGARSSDRREATPPGRAAWAEPTRFRSCEARPHRERTRHGCSRLKQQWQKPVVRITRAGHATAQVGVWNLCASPRPLWITAWRGPRQKPRTKRCASRRLVHHRTNGGSDCRRKQAVSRHGGRRPESRLRHPFTGVAQERLWPVGLLRWRSRKTAESELLAGAQASVGRVVGREIGGVSRAGPKGSVRRALDGWCRFEGARRRRWDVRGRWIRGEGSPSGNNARRVSVASIERCASNGSSSS